MSNVVKLNQPRKTQRLNATIYGELVEIEWHSPTVGEWERAKGTNDSPDEVAAIRAFLLSVNGIPINDVALDVAGKALEAVTAFLAQSDNA